MDDTSRRIIRRTDCAGLESVSLAVVRKSRPENPDRVYSAVEFECQVVQQGKQSRVVSGWEFCEGSSADSPRSGFVVDARVAVSEVVTYYNTRGIPVKVTNWKINSYS